MAHLHRWALAFLGFWVRQAPTRIAADDAASSACHTQSRRWKRQSGEPDARQELVPDTQPSDTEPLAELPVLT